MRKQFVKRKISCLILVAVLLVTAIPANVYAENVYKYRFVVKTANEDNAGTDGWVNVGVTFWDGTDFNNYCDIPFYNDFERDSRDEYEFERNERIPFPWMLKSVYVWLDRYIVQDHWKCEYVEVYLPYVLDTHPSLVATAYFNRWIEDNGERVYVDVSSQTRRKITSYNDYDGWGGTFYLDNNSQNTISNSWNGRIKDQYFSSYNPVSYDDPPIFDYRLSHPQISQTDRNKFLTFSGLTSSGASISIKEKELYNVMTSNNIGKLDLTVRLGFPSRSTDSSGLVAEGNYLCRNKTYTFYRCVFDLGNASISQTQTFNARPGFNYLNRTLRNVKITISPTSIYCGTITDQQKRDIVNNFNCKATLYLGNNTSKKLCDMTLKKDGTNLVFEGVVPMDIEGSPNEGLRLQLDNISSTIGGKTYILQDGTTSKYFYFTDYKVDTVYPAIRLTDVNGTDVSIQNSIKSEHNFYFVSSEVLYPEKDVAHTSENERYLRYELYQKTGETYGSSPVAITGYLGSGSQTQVQAPVSTSVIQDAMIRLKTANPIEGQFKLRIYGYDDANNGLFGNDYYEIENIYLDRKAPRVQVTETIQNQAPDGTKRNDYTFDIEDIQTSRDFGSWARTYYCFVEEGQQVSDPASQNIEKATGEIDVIVGKWAFVEGGTETTTAVLKVPKGETFKGKLYYYTLDSCGNDSRNEQNGYFTKDVVIHNYDAKDTLITEPYTYPKSNYNISFDLSDENYRTEYRWIAKDNSFIQDYRVYTGNENVGSGVQIDKNGQEHVLDGVYTLQYKVTELKSGNWRVFEKDYVFDNKGPIIKTNWLTNSSLLLPVQQLKVDIDDVSGLTSAEYQIVNPDGSAIEGYDKTPINITTSADNRGIVNETLTFQLPENGVYGLIITARDNNGIVSTVGNLTFGIRNEKPQITNIAHNLDVLVDGWGATADGQYQLTLNIVDEVNNVESLSTEQDVRYCVSFNGTDYSGWITAENVERTINDDNIVYTVKLDKPFDLVEGWNNLYIKVACVNSGTVDDPVSSVVSDAYP